MTKAQLRRLNKKNQKPIHERYEEILKKKAVDIEMMKI